jgi:hypothetical protein
MLELFPCERVAAEIGAGGDRDRDLGRRTIGEDSAHLFSRDLISKTMKMWKWQIVMIKLILGDIRVHKCYSRILQLLQLPR